MGLLLAVGSCGMQLWVLGQLGQLTIVWLFEVLGHFVLGM